MEKKPLVQTILQIAQNAIRNRIARSPGDGLSTIRSTLGRITLIRGFEEKYSLFVKKIGGSPYLQFK
jgi:hypothetical protein